MGDLCGLGGPLPEGLEKHIFGALNPLIETSQPASVGRNEIFAHICFSFWPGICKVYEFLKMGPAGPPRWHLIVYHPD